jgi:hypothetical protein
LYEFPEGPESLIRAQSVDQRHVPSASPSCHFQEDLVFRYAAQRQPLYQLRSNFQQPVFFEASAAFSGCKQTMLAWLGPPVFGNKNHRWLHRSGKQFLLPQFRKIKKHSGGEMRHQAGLGLSSVRLVAEKPLSVNNETDPGMRCCQL